MLVRMLRMYRVLGPILGRWFAPLPIGLLIVVRVFIVISMQQLDRISSRIRNQQASNTIVLLGSPRSGTTFLHRYLDSNGVGTGLRVWDSLFPSVVLHKILAPLIPLIEKSNRARAYQNVAHETGLMLVDTDDVAIMARYLDGALLEAWIHAFRANTRGPRRDTNQRDFAWLQLVWNRTLAVRGGRRIVAKLHSLTYRLPAFLDAVPDAKVIYMVRDPLQSIPSAMSLVTTMLERRFGFWKLPDEVRKQYLANLYVLLLNGYKRFVEDWESGAIDRNRVMILRYDRMMSDFSSTMADLLLFVGHEPNDALKDAIANTSGVQRAYASHHNYDPQKFGLDPAQIRRDCQFLYDAFFADLRQEEMI